MNARSVYAPSWKTGFTSASEERSGACSCSVRAQLRQTGFTETNEKRSRVHSRSVRVQPRQNLSGTGFTLIELLVSISIILVIIGIAVFNHQQFGGMIELSNTTENVALALRKAQVEGLAVREYSAGGTFDPGRGVHFDIQPSGGDGTIYRYFADGVNGTPDGKFTSGDDVTLETESLQTGFEILELQRLVPAGSFITIGTKKLTITFRRPRPEARFDFPGMLGINPAAVRIIIGSTYDPDLKAYVEVNQSGQVTTGRL